MTAAQPSTRIQPTIVPQVGTTYPRRRARTATVNPRSLTRAGLAVAFTATLLLTAYIGEYATVARASAQRAEARAELRRMKQENSNLHAQVEILERPARIDQIARAREMEQRNDADFVKLAPVPAPPPTAQKNRPILAGFLPESVARLLSHAR